jgi:hypothetical protein
MRVLVLALFLCLVACAEFKRIHGPLQEYQPKEAKK